MNSSLSHTGLHPCPPSCSPSSPEPRPQPRPQDGPAPRPHPTKEEVRAWLARRSRAGLPPPPPDEIRRELHWHLLPSPPDSAMPAILLPLVLAEFTAVTVVAWYWLVLQQSRECQQAIC